MTMDHTHFDALTRSVGTASRRNFGRALAGGGLAALFASACTTLDVDANKKRHKKKRKAQPLIAPPPPVTTPVPAARKVGTCSALRNRCAVVDPAIAICDPTNQFAACLRTASGEPFCGTLFGFQTSVNCKACNQDADCLEFGFPPGSACVQLDSGQFCTGCEATNNRACVPTAIPD
jgi:hypothetical protein